MLGIHGSDDGLHLCRMTKDPRNGNCCLGNLLPICNLGKGLIQLREIRMIDEGTTKHAKLQGRPCLNGNILQTTIIQGISIAIDGEFGGLSIQLERLIDQLGLFQGKLHLIKDKRLLYELFQKLNLHGN